MRHFLAYFVERYADVAVAFFDGIFQETRGLPECRVLKHAVILGRGRAMKTGINYIYLTFPRALGVFTADGGGQHVDADILRMGDPLKANSNALILGDRSFEKKISIRRLPGNRITGHVFSFLVGKKIADMQTGLRGIPRDYLWSNMSLLFY